MDQSRFKSEILPCYRRMHSVAMAILRDVDDASDAVQEAFVRLWERRGDLDSLQSPEAYTITVVKRVCIDRLRASRPYGRLDAASLQVEASQDDIDGRDALGMLRRLMESLPANQKKVLTLSSFGGCSNEEIAKITGENDGNVRQLLSRARKKLRELYQKYES